MRITINLSLFFHDHRCLAKIFVNRKKMKSIRDVEEHITGIFKIENFYMKCENQYLPPTEDVHILHNDDVVWVIPENEHPSHEHVTFGTNNVYPQNLDISAEVNMVPKKKKKKKKELHTNTNEDNFNCEIENEPKRVKLQKNSDDLMEVEDTSVLKEKKRKRKMVQNYEEMPEQKQEHQELEEINMNTHISKNQKLDDSSSSHVCIDSVQKDSGRDSFCLDTSKSADTPDSNNSSVKCLVDEFEKKKNLIKQLNESPYNEPERRVNIVKTIIISNRKTASLSSLPDIKQTEVSEEQRDNSSDKHTEETEEKRDTKYHNGDNLKKNVDEHQANESSSNADTSNLSNVTEFDTNVNKRRRRRTRKRRSAAQNTSEITTTYKQPVYNFIHKPLIVQTQTPTHLRFAEDQQSIKKEVVVPPSEPVVDQVAAKDSSHDVIIVNESPKRESVKADDIINENIETNVTVYSDKEIEDCISKQPVTQNLEPRVGDVVAFKILRISENYTPEVSKSIIGKVRNYKNENKEIAFDILYGRDQCMPTRGKFSLDQEDSQVNESSQFQCLWSTLLEPRLVYP